VADSQRERVLAAMRELVAGRGLQDVPVAEVIRRAGVSRKTFYELYPGKEECFVAVYERELERLISPTLQAFAGTEAWVDRLRTALGVLLGTLAADPDGARICFVEVLAAGPKALARRNTAMAALDPLFDRAHVSTAVGVTRPMAVTAGSIGYLSEVLHREVAAGRTAELPGLRAELMYTLTLPFVGPHNAGKELAREGADAPTGEDAAERSFLSAYGAVAAGLLGRVSAAMAAEDREAPERLRAGVDAVLAFCAEDPDGARACFVEALSAGPAARERRSETTRRLAELFEQPLRELRPSERIARVSAIALVGGLVELIYDAVDRRAVGALPSIDTVVAVARL
jgi:AcrR family transcriptional regulator